MNQMPALFVSHGSPDLILRDIPARAFMASVATLVPRPRAVLSVSAHWETETPAVDLCEAPETIHDFFGFPAPLYEMRYPAKGAPELAMQAKTLVEQAGLGPVATARRGLDHGAWVPMILPWPEADIPVCQLSIQSHRRPRDHYALGRALAPLRDDGVMIMGSGNLNHNLSALMRTANGFATGAPTPDWVVEFRDWMAAAVTKNRTEDLLNYRAVAPHAVENHPEDEHLMPLFVALGAGHPDRPGRVIHASYDYGVLAMDGYAFD